MNQEENKPVNIFNIIAVCSYCRNHDKEAAIEINFSDLALFYFCPACKKMNKIDLSKSVSTPYPKSKRM